MPYGTRRKPWLRVTCAMAVWLALAGATRPATSHAEVASHGPVVSFGYAEKLRNDLFLPALGWRFRFAAGERIGGWAKRIGTDLSFAVEPMVAGIFGDETSVEAQIVPFVHLEPAAMRQRSWRPYFEGGIGIIYTAVEDLSLGSNFLFSDNLGLGVSFGTRDAPCWSRVGIGYRYRHISHAGIFGEPNSGMNTHAIVLTFD